MTGFSMVTDTGTQGSDEGLQGQQQTSTADQSQGQAGQQASQQQQATPTWFDDATKFYVGKKTGMNAQDEMGQEMWRSIQEGNKLKGQLDELSPYKTDLEWIMSVPELAQAVVRHLQGIQGGQQSQGSYDQGQQQDQGDDGEMKLPPNHLLVQKINQLERLQTAQIESSIQSNFNAHLTELQQKYPLMDAEEVRKEATWSGAIYDPKAPELVEKIAQASQDKYDKLRQRFTDEALQGARQRGMRTPPSATATPSQAVKGQDFRSDFDAAYEETFGR